MGEQVRRLLLTTIPGLERLVLAELTRLMPKLRLVRVSKGRVLVEVDGVEHAIREILAKSRLVEHLILVLWGGEGESLTDLRREISESVGSLKQYIGYGMSFAVKAERIGRSPVKSLELASIVGGAVEGMFAARKVRVSLDNPDITLYACIDGARYLLGVLITAFRPLHERGYRAYVHPSMLNPVIANAMIDLAGNPTSVIDPFCGSGTIIIERWLRGGTTLLLGMDVKYRHVRGALANARQAGAVVDLIVGDVRLPPLRRISIDAVITNPPFGLRERPIGGLRPVYAALRRLARQVSADVLVVITPRRRLLQSIFRGFTKEREITVEHGGMRSSIFVLRGGRSEPCRKST